MDSVSIDLRGSQIESIDFEDACLTIRFSQANLIKTMTGSREMTRWRQVGELIIQEAQLHSPTLTGPLICTGGDIDENIYTYRNMIPVPLDSRGHSRCELHFENVAEPLVASGKSVRLVLKDTPKYIEHIR